MRIGSRFILAAIAGATLTQMTLLAADEKPQFKDDKEKASYAIGMYCANMVRRGNVEVDVDVVLAAMKDSLNGKELRLTDAQSIEAIRNYQQETRRKAAEKNKAEGTAYMAANKIKPGVKIMTVELSETNKVDMQYKVITEGTGPTPGSNDMVTVKYRGTFVNGKEFDKADKRIFPLTGVIKGWTSALEKMKVGSKWELVIPPALAYGDMGRPNIEPGSTLLYELELLGSEVPPPPATPPPLTSDIIKVPSAEELKKGAKIEVIKPEDAARMAAEAQKKAGDEKK